MRDDSNADVVDPAGFLFGASSHTCMQPEAVCHMQALSGLCTAIDRVFDMIP